MWDSEKFERGNEVEAIRSFIVRHPVAVVTAIGVGVTTLLMMRRRHRSSSKHTARAMHARTHQSPQSDNKSTLRTALGAAATAALMAAARHLAYRAVAEANERWIRPA